MPNSLKWQRGKILQTEICKSRTALRMGQMEWPSANQRSSRPQETVSQVEEARRADWGKAASGICSSHRSWGGFKLMSVGTESWRDDKTRAWFQQDLLRANWISYPHTPPRQRLQQHWSHASFGNLLSENSFKLSGWRGIGVLMKELVTHGILSLVWYLENDPT